MKKIIFGIICVSSFAINASDSLVTGTFNGKKKCSMTVELVERYSPRFGNYQIYEVTTKNKKNQIVFDVSLSSAEIAREFNSLGSANGNDISGMTLNGTLDDNGFPLEYKVEKFTTFFGRTKKKTIINCKF